MTQKHLQYQSYHSENIRKIGGIYFNKIDGKSVSLVFEVNTPI